MKKFLTDEEVEKEITRLANSPYVKLAKEQERIKYQRRQYLYNLRSLEKKGKKLYEAGITLDAFEDMAISILEGEYDD
jgi:hypothetical protein